MEKESLKEILVVALQEGSNYHFQIKSHRVPKLGECIAERNLVWQVENVMTFLKDGIGYPVVVVKRIEPDRDMENLLNELDRQV